MSAKRTGKSNRDNGAASAGRFDSSAANSFLLSQRMALEAARFWARRLHAYADQMETLARCATPADLAAAQTRFLERMRDDYAEESEAVGALLSDAAPAAIGETAQTGN